MEELKVGKLVSGEFVIGRELSNGILINIFKINVTFDTSTGQPNINIVPYMFPIDNKLDYFIHPDKFICMDTAGDKMKEIYVQHITNILQTNSPEETKIDENIQNESNPIKKESNGEE